ncbi:hypothetical protein CANINC_003137 [Pichia inconspicua]|uniref:GPI ethanolamine phosphate transferase 2 n=1 Tax=Pichia inconspicua TaxID=52247 RepID=A0A4T0WZD6_9ASCO|nr:hypothetical protein CANINC_003137 [[Candida] inconspicua]
MKYIGLTIGIALQIGAFLLFCKGFFPTKVLLTPAEVELYKTDPPEGYVEPDQQFNKVVLMVVDAMRADFLFSNNSYMTFAQSLLNDGYGLGFTAFSNPPTVTLPRLKGITTGSTPNFIDAVLNIAEGDTSSTLGDQDSWIKQMYTNKWKINMFGDDTWLKLFPDYFAKTDGTASFYVADFTIVDNNVTRHLDYELSDEGKANWDCLILHYLGLDHIGHKGGPGSTNMPGKQREMDAVIERIFNEVTMNDPNSLFIIMGDHGMNDVGNHGGSSTAETSAALMLVSQKFKKAGLKNVGSAPITWNSDYDYFTKVDQIDLVPTLTEMLGFDVPINNLGTFMSQLLDLYSDDDKKNILIKNALQLKVLLDKSHGFVSDFTDMNVSELLEFVKSAKKELSRSSSAYNDVEILAGLGSYAFITLISLVWFGIYFKDQFSTAFLDVVFFVTYGANFIASSMVEEEHHLWWFFTTVFAAYVIFTKLRSGDYNWAAIVAFMLALRVLKAWNNSGQKHNMKANMKITTYLSDLPAEYGPNVYALLLFITFLPMIMQISSGPDDRYYLNYLQFVISALSFVVATIKMLSFVTATYDVNTETALPTWTQDFLLMCKIQTQLDDYNQILNRLYSLFQKLWILAILVQLVEPYFVRNVLQVRAHSPSYLANVQAISVFFLLSQTHYLNVPLFAVMYVIMTTFSAIAPSDCVHTNVFNVFTLLMQNLTFFQFGGTNALSSVDLTNSFNGLSEYNMIASGLLTYTCNWAGPLFWTLAHINMIFAKVETDKVEKVKWKILFDRLLFNFVFYSVSGLLLLGCCYHLRFHLFIWTVFSPKILYFLSWLLCNAVFDFALSALIVACM